MRIEAILEYKGERRTYVPDWVRPEDDIPRDGALYFWTRGNFGCDCNRMDCFARAGGLGDEDPLWDAAREEGLLEELDSGEKFKCNLGHQQQCKLISLKVDGEELLNRWVRFRAVFSEDGQSAACPDCGKAAEIKRKGDLIYSVISPHEQDCPGESIFAAEGVH